MADFVVRVTSPRPASAVFARLVDWDAHSAAIPLTVLHHEGTPVLGQRFVARTGVGRLGFDDPMRVDLLRPPAGDRPGELPGQVEITKTGRVLRGSVRWTVTPVASGADVEWRQRLIVPWLPGFLDPVVGLVGRAAYGAGLRRLLGS